MTKRGTTSNQSGGRPLLGKRRRVQISISIDAETKNRLRQAAAQRGLSTGLLIDELAAHLERGHEEGLPSDFAFEETRETFA